MEFISEGCDAASFRRCARRRNRNVYRYVSDLYTAQQGHPHTFDHNPKLAQEVNKLFLNGLIYPGDLGDRSAMNDALRLIKKTLSVLESGFFMFF
jgi:hypothetical protein